MTITDFTALPMEEQKIIVNEMGRESNTEITGEGFIEFLQLEDFFVKMEYEGANLVEVQAFQDTPAQ